MGINPLKVLTLLRASSSDITGGPYLIADFTQLSLSRITQVGTASTLTVQMSNADGLGDTGLADATNWSNVTGLTAQGIFGIETGPRWLRVMQKSASSETVILSGLVNR